MLGCLDFSTAIAQILLVYHIEEWGKLTTALVVAVHAVGNGNEEDILLPEYYLCVVLHLKIIPSDSDHVLGDHATNTSGLNVLRQPLPSGALKATRAVAIAV